jgi:phage repressor protein C with HTH and peptisase S24 domain
MQPTYSAGDVLLTRRVQAPSVDDIVVVNTDDVGLIVKRIERLGSDSVTLVGDNPRLASSCCERPHSYRSIVGKVICRLKLPFSFAHRRS